MAIIKKLSESTINRIAAGEVVERPASVIKELIENSIDAGATKIDVIIEQSGKNYISVKDNGAGMSKADLLLAIERHTTSKLDEDDIMHIINFGFRGEALPSIGSVSRMTITSRRNIDDIAHSIFVEGGQHSTPMPAAGESGTKIEIRDLFFATPARLKFLRSDKMETAACVDIVKRIAIAHPHIGFSIISEGKTIFSLTAQARLDAETSFLTNLKSRIANLLGTEFADNAVELHCERDAVKVTGLIGLPTFNRASSDGQFLYVNHRPVKDKLLATAVKVAYQDYIAAGRHPALVVFLEVGPRFVDVNVHPAKSEVRFRDNNLVRGILIAAIKDAIISAGHRVSNVPAMQAINNFLGHNIPANNAAGHASAVHGSPAFQLRQGKQNHYHTPIYGNKEFTASVLKGFEPTARAEAEHLPEEYTTNLVSEYPLGAAVAQLHQNYIIAQSKDSIIIVDQHAAHERLTYEKLKAQVASQIIGQRLLMPEIIEMVDGSAADILIEKQQQLASLGLVISKFGERSIVVTEVPALLGELNIAQLINDLKDDFAELEEDATLSKLVEHVLETYACHHSIRSGRALSITEMNALLREMEAVPTSGQCNHGRPTYIELKLKDIERLFGRS